MSDIVSTYIKPSHINKYLEESEKNGKLLYKKNKNYRTITNCMEHPEFRTFFNDNFSTLDDIKNIILFLKLYQEIEKNTPIKINGYQKLSILDRIIKDRKLRREICDVTTKQYVLSDKLLE